MQSIDLFVGIFKFLCIFGTVFMISYWIYKYHMNKDLSYIEYTPIEAIKDVVYPEPSICFAVPFIRNDRLNITNHQLKHYQKYLQGHEISDDYYELYKNITYDQVTPNLNDYFRYLNIYWKNSSIRDDSCQSLENCQYLKFNNHFNGFHGTVFFKCYGVQIKSQYVKDVDTFFLSLTREFESVLKQVTDVYVGFYQPNQYLRPRGLFDRSVWSGSDYDSALEKFTITSVEILQRRNKRNKRCLENWKEYDDWVLKLFLSSVGCRPPYIEQHKEFPSCNTSKEVNRAYYDGWSYAKNNKDHLLEPCQEMPFINYKHDVKLEGSGNGSKSYLLSVSYPPLAKMISQSQAVDAHSLIGNIGGYIGLFLGALIINQLM